MLKFDNRLVQDKILSNFVLEILNEFKYGKIR